MNNDPKLMLSDEEQQLVNNTHWILTKRVILDKVGLLLGELSEQQKTIIENEKGWLPPEVCMSQAKISRGENYLQLPYLILDHPRCFDAENIFAVRTMFWWGNFFSVTLHLSGKYKTIYQERICERLPGQKQDIFICINENPWQHHFEGDNYTSIKQLSTAHLQGLIYEKQFLKLAIKFPLQQWNTIPALLQEEFKEIITMLKD